MQSRSVVMVTCCDGPPTPLTGPASPAGACGIGAPAGTPRPAARPTPGPPATPANGTRAIPVWRGRKAQRRLYYNLECHGLLINDCV